ncbi:MAG: argininosuccinate lyase [bacterium]|nr:argininosuccinate lyase [bacterium]MDE0600678.1 argininosuccinate lyase [bacterium]
MTLWEGRLEGVPASEMWDFTVSTADRRLLADDIEGSMAHVAMLGEVGILSERETEEITAGLRTLSEEAGSGAFIFKDSDEDVHSAVERRLVELVGPVGGKLHTGRSRNDQVALDLILYMRRGAARHADGLARLALVLVDVAERLGPEVVVPSYTHLQQAQPTLFAHHLLAYGQMAARDRRRFLDLGARLDCSPLGAGAAAGSSLPLSPGISASLLGMSGAFANSLEAVGSRDRAAEYVWCCARALVSLSRLGEDLVLWSTREFGWVTLADEFATGSSALPQKKNPDIAELVRGKAAGAIGALTAMLALEKGLPMSYNRDLQEDKEHLFRVDDDLAGGTSALAGLLATARFHPPAPASETAALDLAEALVGRGVPFREAHRVTGAMAARLAADNREFSSLSFSDLARAHPGFEPSDLDLLDPAVSVSRRATPGAGSPESVAAQICELRGELSGGES